jgi:hypothetical protein
MRRTVVDNGHGVVFAAWLGNPLLRTGEVAVCDLKQPLRPCALPLLRYWCGFLFTEEAGLATRWMGREVDVHTFDGARPDKLLDRGRSGMAEVTVANVEWQERHGGVCALRAVVDVESIESLPVAGCGRDDGALGPAGEVGAARGEERVGAGVGEATDGDETDAKLGYEQHILDDECAALADCKARGANFGRLDDGSIDAPHGDGRDRTDVDELGLVGRAVHGRARVEVPRHAADMHGGERVCRDVVDGVQRAGARTPVERRGLAYGDGGRCLVRVRCGKLGVGDGRDNCAAPDDLLVVVEGLGELLLKRRGVCGLDGDKRALDERVVLPVHKEDLWGDRRGCARRGRCGGGADCGVRLSSMASASWATLTASVGAGCSSSAGAGCSSSAARASAGAAASADGGVGELLLDMRCVFGGLWGRAVARDVAVAGAAPALSLNRDRGKHLHGHAGAGAVNGRALRRETPGDDGRGERLLRDVLQQPVTDVVHVRIERTEEDGGEELLLVRRTGRVDAVKRLRDGAHARCDVHRVSPADLRSE